MRRLLLTSAFALALTACSQAETPVPEVTPSETTMAEQPFEGKQVETDFINNEGTIIGQGSVLAGPNGLLVRVTVNEGGLTPGWHGIHFHQVGDCSDLEGFKKSGGHVGLIPGGHGLINPIGPEAGDIANIWAGPNGSAGYETFSNLITVDQLLDEDGSAIVIHANEDDHITQPIGGAGPRIACAVLK